MRIQKRYWFGLAALALIGLSVFFSLPPCEPIVNNHPLGYWLENNFGNNLEDSSAEFQKALPAIDDRCIPALIEELKWSPSPMLRSAEKFNMKWVHGRLSIHEPKDLRFGAALVLGSLGPRASNAIPTLENLSQSHDVDNETSYTQRGAAIAALILIRRDSMDVCARKSLDMLDPDKYDYQCAIVSLGTNATSTIPIFVNALQATTNSVVRYTASRALGWIHSRPDLSLPPLISMLRETNTVSRSQGADALVRFRDTAKPAWNDLVPLLNDPDETVRFFTKNALQAIDPAAAEQLGIDSFQ